MGANATGLRWRFSVRSTEAAITADRPVGWQIEARMPAIPAPDVERLAESDDAIPSGPSDNPILAFDAE
ncbi:MAG: hypothetical protein ACRD12_06980 [Acidimicrobiales bacterium]